MTQAQSAAFEIVGVDGAGGENRTLTILTDLRILSRFERKSLNTPDAKEARIHWGISLQAASRECVQFRRSVSQTLANNNSRSR